MAYMAAVRCGLDARALLPAPEATALGKYGLLRRMYLRTEKKAGYTGGNPGQPSPGDRPAGGGTGGGHDRAAGPDGGRGGGRESVGPAEMGGADERLQASNGGSRAATADLQLNEGAEDTSSAPSISQAETDTVLLWGSGSEGGKYRIYEQLLQGESAKNVSFLRDEYSTGGCTIYAARKLDVWYDGKGTRITAAPDIKTKLTWKQAAKRIRALIAADRYLTPAEKEAYPAYREQQAVLAARGKLGDEFYAIVSDYKDHVDSAQDKTAANWYLAS